MLYKHNVRDLTPIIYVMNHNINDIVCYRTITLFGITPGQPTTVEPQWTHWNVLLLSQRITAKT